MSDGYDTAIKINKTWALAILGIVIFVLAAVALWPR